MLHALFKDFIWSEDGLGAQIELGRDGKWAKTTRRRRKVHRTAG
jgi:hypothetical protein